MPIPSRPLKATFRAGCVLGLAALAACGGRSKPPEGGVAPRAPGTPPPRTISAGPEFDAARLYTQMGFLSAGAPLPFIGAVSVTVPVNGPKELLRVTSPVAKPVTASLKTTVKLIGLLLVGSL